MKKKPNKDLKLSERDWTLLNPGSEVKKYSAGQEVLGLDVVNRHLFRIKKGTVRVEKVINGQTVIVDKLKEKTMFGEISMLLRSEQCTTTAAIVADENGTEVIKYKIESVMEMCRVEHALSEKLHKIIALKLSERLRNFGSNKKKDESSEDHDKDPSERSEKEEKEDEKEKLELPTSSSKPDQEEIPTVIKKDARTSSRLLHGESGPPLSSESGTNVSERKNQAKLEKKSIASTYDSTKKRKIQKR